MSVLLLRVQDGKATDKYTAITVRLTNGFKEFQIGFS